ncbi:aminomethyl transferase family protein, partial [Candidatus Saccharibacteria bacterium]|nr:aminomethyl transferase family protein [Candidatus Saccharibacteria bacterium]
WFSLAMVAEHKAVDGSEVVLIWGEKNGGSEKPTVERHTQTEIRAVISTKRLTD